jgi:H+-transporting ATPase
LSTIILFVVIVYTTFFEDRFGVTPYKEANLDEMHMIIYLQVAMISQALIFITRSHGFFFLGKSLR